MLVFFVDETGCQGSTSYVKAECPWFWNFFQVHKYTVFVPLSKFTRYKVHDFWCFSDNEVHRDKYTNFKWKVGISGTKYSNFNRNSDHNWNIFIVKSKFVLFWKILWYLFLLLMTTFIYQGSQAKLILNSITCACWI